MSRVGTSVEGHFSSVNLPALRLLPEQDVFTDAKDFSRQLESAIGRGSMSAGGQRSSVPVASTDVAIDTRPEVSTLWGGPASELWTGLQLSSVERADVNRKLSTAAIIVASFGIVGAAQSAGNVAAGKARSVVCAGCHGVHGEGL